MRLLFYLFIYLVLGFLGGCDTVILSPNPENYIINLHYHENLKYCIFLIYLSVCGLFNNVVGSTYDIALAIK